MNSGANEYLFAAAAIDLSDAVLDVGCGNGATSRIAARQAARGHVFGIDLSLPMLERARTTAVKESLVNVRFERGDAQVYRLISSSFDVAISRFAVMFFADPVVAFANIRRALGPGGRLAFVSLGNMRSNDLKVVFAALAGYLPNSTSAAATEPGPLSLADPVHFALERADQLDNTQIVAAITDALRPFEQPDDVRLRGEHWLVRAVHPVNVR